MGAGAVLFWPNPVPAFDAEKALAFATALVIWLAAEWFATEENGAEDIPTIELVPLAEHDRLLGQKLFSMCSAGFLDFLKAHDLGVCWRKEQMDPLYQLSYFLDDVAHEFVDDEIQVQLIEIKQSTNKLAHDLAYGAWPLRGNSNLFTMVPDAQRATDDWSNQTAAKVEKANGDATHLANLIENLFRALRGKGLTLMSTDDASENAA